MKRGRQILMAGVGILLVGAVAGEDHSRRLLARRYYEAMETRRQLELQFGEIVATHEQLKTELTSEQQRSRELSEALESTRNRLEETTGRLAEESRNVRELRMRLASMQEQMDQLQGELAVTLQPDGPAEALEGLQPVQLERIVVSEGGDAGLSGRVVSIHKEWNFIVIDLGWDAVRIGDTVSIFRNDHLLAKARVDRVQEGICAATVLPEWEMAEIQVNDLARPL